MYSTPTPTPNLGLAHLPLAQASHEAAVDLLRRGGEHLALVAAHVDALELEELVRVRGRVRVRVRARARVGAGLRLMVRARLR